jgi:hypothetical protein
MHMDSNLKSTSQNLQSSFESPLAEHTACPLWFWNGDMEPGEMIRQIDEMLAKGVRAFVIHARVGLTVPYLSEHWFERVGLTLDAAAERGMKVWIYDEENWPSGYAGGRIIVQDPQFAGQNLIIERHYVNGPLDYHLTIERPDETPAVIATRIARIEPKSADPLQLHRHAPTTPEWYDSASFSHYYAAEAPQSLNVVAGMVDWRVPEGHWCVMVARQQPTDWVAAYSNLRYVDLMNEAAIDTFIEATHAEYFRRFARHFGDTILGFFVDEPGFYNNFWDRNVGSITWTHDFAQQFAQRRGYDLLPWLPALWENLGECTASVRYDYWQTIAELLHERFFNKLASWCTEHKVQLTGHLEWEEWLFTMTRHSANPFQALAPFHVPGVDKIDEVTDKLAEKLASSVAHAQGRSRVLSETFALIGWKLAPAYMKQIVDYQYVRGVNWLACHGFYYSIEGFRRHESAPSEFFQNPWWEHSRPMWDYVARLSAVLSQGSHVAPVALYYPIEHAWTTMTPTAPRPLPSQGVWEAWQLPDAHLPVQQTDRALLNLGLCLLEHQYDFDLVDWSVVTAAQAKDGRLQTAHEQFDVIVVPPMDVMHGGALQRLLDVARSGGTVLFVKQLPGACVDGPIPDVWQEVRRHLLELTMPGVVRVDQGQVCFAPQGIDAAMHLLSRIRPPDLLVDLGDDAARMLTHNENRNGISRETVIRPLRSALKYHRRQVEQANIYFLVNESDQSFSATIRLAGRPDVELWNPQTGERQHIPHRVIDDHHVAVDLPFAPWQSYLLALIAARSQVTLFNTLQLIEPQTLHDWRIAVGGIEWRDQLHSWHTIGLAHFSGRGVYQTRFALETPPDATTQYMLDLGTVFETASVTINGVTLPPLAWPPYQIDISAHVRSGENSLEITVANTNTNAFEGRERPSGMLGPVRLLRTKN